jgi:protein-tyrosine phosphatase
MAEALFMQLVRKAGLESSIEADSAGTADWEIDAAPHPGTLALLRRSGIEYSGRGRNLLPADLDRFDYVITMDEQNLRDVRRIGSGSAMIAPLMSFATESSACEIPDPYFDDRFDLAQSMIQEGVEGLLEHIVVAHRLRPAGGSDE